VPLSVLIGTNSGGCVLGFLDDQPLEGGGDLSLSEFGFITPKGKTPEGRGVTPDRVVPVRLTDLRTGRAMPRPDEAVPYLNLDAALHKNSKRRDRES
jgi:C-terminal processing protease CtpA/Prc